jgi:hypothetical protein
MKKINDYESRKCMMLYVSWLKAMHNWFHAAHHVTSGATFSGDHVNLYGKIYQEIEDDIDGAIEKAVGLTGDKRMACPILINKTVIVILNQYQSPVYDGSEDIVEVASNIVTDYLVFLEEMFKVLEEKDMLSLGLNDMLSASANKFETYVYLLEQRKG